MASAFDAAESSVLGMARGVDAAAAKVSVGVETAVGKTAALETGFQTAAAAAVRLDSLTVAPEVPDVAAVPIAGLAKLDAAFGRVADSAAARFEALRDRAASAAGAMRDRVSGAVATLRTNLSVTTDRLTEPFQVAAAKVRSSIDGMRARVADLRTAVGERLSAAGASVAGFARRVEVSTIRTRTAFQRLGGRLLAPLQAAMARTSGAAQTFAGRVRTATGAAAVGVSRFTASLRRVVGAAGTAAGGLRSWISGLRGAKTAQDSTGSSAKQMLASFGGNLLAMAAAGIAKLGAAAVSSAVSFGVMGENSRFALGVLSKGRAPGEKLFAHASALAQRFGLDLQDTQAKYTSFLALDLSPKMADQLVRLGADFKAVGNEAAASKIVDVMKELNTKGGVTELGVVDQLKELNISRDAFAKAVGDVTGATEAIDLEAEIKAGNIDASVARDAVIKAVNDSLGQGKAGEIGARFADETTTGAVGKIKATLGVALSKALEGATGSAAKALQPAADRLAAFFDSPEGAKTLDMIGKAIGKVIDLATVFFDSFGDAFGETWKTLKAAAEPVLTLLSGKGDTVTSVVKALASALGTAAAIATGVVIAFGAVTAAAVTLQTILFGAVQKIAVGVVEGLGRIVFAVTDWWANLTAIWDNGALGIVDKTIALGAEIVRGIVDGIKGAGGMAIDAIKGLGTSMLSSFKETLGIASPSKAFWKLTTNVGTGITGSADEQRPAVAKAGAGLGDALFSGAEASFGAGPSFDVDGPSVGASLHPRASLSTSGNAVAKTSTEPTVPAVNARSLGSDVAPAPLAQATKPQMFDVKIDVPEIDDIGDLWRGFGRGGDDAPDPYSPATAPAFGLGTADAPAQASPAIGAAVGGGRAASGPVHLHVNVVAGSPAEGVTTEQLAQAAERGGRRALDDWMRTIEGQQ